MKSRRRQSLCLAIGGILMTLLVALVTGGSSAAACKLCHREVVLAQDKSSHASVGCYRCHAPGASRVSFKANEIFRMYPKALLGWKPQGPVRDTSTVGCNACHDGSNERTPGRTGIRILHSSCALGSSCDSCHSTTAHGEEVRWKRQAVMEDCTACHQREKAVLECDACHEGALKTARLAAGPWQVTHGPLWRQTHGMGKLDSCVTCHPDDYCKRCHKVSIPHPVTFGSEHGPAAVADRASCEKCHKSRAFCDSCHGIVMPHIPGYLAKHSGETSSTSDPRCTRCHTKQTCERCHARHIHPGGPGGKNGPSFPGRVKGDSK